MTNEPWPTVSEETGQYPQIKASEMDQLHAEEILLGRVPETGMSFETAVIVTRFLAAHPEWRVEPFPEPEALHDEPGIEAGG